MKMEWEPVEIDRLDFEDPDDSEPDLCLDCYGRGQPRLPLMEVRIPSKETFMKYADKTTKHKRGRGRAQVLRERALQRTVGVRDDTVSQESASLMDSASELDSSASRLNPGFTNSSSSSGSKSSFMDKWLNSLDGQDVTFSEPNEQSQLPEGFGNFSKSYKKGPKRAVEDYLKVMDNITMVSRGRKSVSRSYRNDSTNVTPASSSLNDPVSKSHKNDSLNVTPATSTVNDSSLEALASLSDINKKDADECIVKGVECNVNMDDMGDIHKNGGVEVTSENFAKDMENKAVSNKISTDKETSNDDTCQIKESTVVDKSVDISQGTSTDAVDIVETRRSDPVDISKEPGMLEEPDINLVDLQEETISHLVDLPEESNANADKLENENKGEEVASGAADVSQEEEPERTKKESLPLVLENIPENCSLTTLLDIAGSYGEIKECNFDECQHSAMIVYYSQEACDFAQENLNGEDGFFEDGAPLKAYKLEAQHDLV